MSRGRYASRATSDPATFEQLAGRFDLILNTVSAAIDVDAYLRLLAVDGALVNVGAPPEPTELPAPPRATWLAAVVTAPVPIEERKMTAEGESEADSKTEFMTTFFVAVQHPGDDL